jgi:hypothetical protein
VSHDEGFDNQAFFTSLCEKCHPHLRTSSCQKPRSILTRVLAPLGLLGLTSWPSRPLTLFAILLFVCVTQRDYRGCFPPPSIYSGCGVTLIFTYHLLVALSVALMIPPSVLQFAFELHALLVDVMEEERSLILDIVGDVSKVPLSEVSTDSSSSDASSGGGAASDEAKAKVEDTVVVDPREFARSYDFGASFVTVGRIRQLESL